MTTEKFTTAAETFTKNVNETMKWLQDTTATILETQTKQMKSASEIYNKTIHATLENMNTNNLSNAFCISETMVDILQKNMEIISNISKTTMKTAWEFGKQTSSENYSKETIAKAVDAYKKQIEEITAFNKKSFDTISKQFANTTTWTPWAEKFKKEFETTVETSKGKMKEIVDTYNKLTTPSVEANKELFNKLNKQIDTGVNENLKLWSEFTNAYATKYADVKNPADYTTTKKKQTTEVNN